jgi:hypothetical protein
MAGLAALAEKDDANFGMVWERDGEISTREPLPQPFS